jgi:hypothetical protein
MNCSVTVDVFALFWSFSQLAFGAETVLLMLVSCIGDVVVDCKRHADFAAWDSPIIQEHGGGVVDVCDRPSPTVCCYGRRVPVKMEDARLASSICPPAGKAAGGAQ